MRRCKFWMNGAIAFAACCTMALTADSAFAQRYGRQSAANRLQRPTVSPYMNLFRRGGTGLPNYQTLVRPELQQLQTNGLQQAEISQLRSALVAEQQQTRARTLPQTGHESRFRYYSHFYSRKK